MIGPLVAPLPSAIPEVVRFVVEHAALAPSSGNRQPWRFQWDGERIGVRHDLERARSPLDSGHRASWLALGAAIENLEIAAAHRGMYADIAEFPAPADPTFVAAVALVEAAPRASLTSWYPWVRRRVTNRARAPRQPISGSQLLRLVQAAGAYDARVQLSVHPDEIQELAAIVGAADRLCASWAPGAGSGESGSRDDVIASSAVALLSFEGADPYGWVRCGHAVQRVWLAATSVGLALHPTMSLLRMNEARADDPSRFTGMQASVLAELYRRLGEVLSGARTSTPALLFRLTHAPEITTRSTRRPLEEVLELAPGA